MNGGGSDLYMKARMAKHTTIRMVTVQAGEGVSERTMSE
jgi:hypothetical protein